MFIGFLSRLSLLFTSSYFISVETTPPSTSVVATLS